MRKLRIVLKEEKNNNLLKEASYFSGRGFDIHEQLRQTLKTKKLQIFNEVEGLETIIAGHPKSVSLESYTKLSNIITNLDTALETTEGAGSFTQLLNNFSKVDLFLISVNELRDVTSALKEYYRATVYPFHADELLNNNRRYYNLIQTVNNLYGRELTLTLQQIDGYLKKLNAAAGEKEWKQFLFGASEKQKKELVNLIAKSIASFISKIVDYKISSERYSTALITQLSGVEATPAGGEPPAPPVTGRDGEGEPPPTPPTDAPPSSRVIPISSGLYRDLTSSGIPRTVALEIVRALRADLEGAGYTLRESLQTAKANLTDILLREEYLYTSALYDLLLLEKAQADREFSYDQEIKRLRSGLADIARGKNRTKKAEKIQSFKDLVDRIKLSYKNNEIRKDGVTSMIANINRAMDELGAEKIDLASIISSEPKPPSSAPDASPAKEERPIEPESVSEPEAPASDESVDYWKKYFVDRDYKLERDREDTYKTTIDAIQSGESIEKIIDSYVKWVLGRRASVEKAVGQEMRLIGKETKPATVTERIKSIKYNDERYASMDTSKLDPKKDADKLATIDYNKALLAFDKKTGGNFVKNYTNLINAVKKIRELVKNPQDSEAKDPRAVKRHIQAAFPKELGFTPEIQQKVLEAFTSFINNNAPKAKSSGKNLVKDMGKTKAIDQRNFVQFVKSLGGKTEADRAALKKVNAPNVATQVVKKFLSNYGIRLAESRYQSFVNVLITESTKHQTLVREYYEHVNNNLLPYMQKQIGFNRPPTINFVDDPINAQNPFGKTAFYDPQLMEITVYTTGRHPKDIMRSVAHEVIHHAQNCRGQLDPQRMGEASEGYAQKNPYLRKLEEEAYLLGNMTFRDWEDGMKNNQLNEMHDCNKVHPNKSHAAYKRDDEVKEEKSLDEWKNEERWDLLMKRFKIVSEKRFANDPKLDKDGDGKPKWADEDDNDPEDSTKKVDEKKLSKSEKKEKERIVKGMKDKEDEFEKRYPGRGKEVMYATATKKAKESK